MSEKIEKQTLVEEGTEFVGTLRAKCPVVVRGVVEGDLEAPEVHVAESGTVTGNVKAQRVRSHGTLAGSVEADDILLAGQVKSNTVIRAKSLEVKLSSTRGRLEVTFGDCLMEVGDAVQDAATTDDKAVAKAPVKGASPEPLAADAARRGRSRGRDDGPEAEPSLGASPRAEMGVSLPDAE